MAHYAKVNNNIVEKVIVAEAEFFDTFVDDSPGEWIKTSYNMRDGIYYDPETNQPAADQSVIDNDEARKRKNYAGVGFIYNRELDAFIRPKPYNSWILNETTCAWEAPVAKPTETIENNQYYFWNESILNWEIKND